MATRSSKKLEPGQELVERQRRRALLERLLEPVHLRREVLGRQPARRLGDRGGGLEEGAEHRREERHGVDQLLGLEPHGNDQRKAPADRVLARPQAADEDVAGRGHQHEVHWLVGENQTLGVQAPDSLREPLVEAGCLEIAGVDADEVALGRDLAVQPDGGLFHARQRYECHGHPPTFCTRRRPR